MRFRAEFDMDESDCRRCPCFRRETDDLATCVLAELHDEPCLMNSVMVPSDRWSVRQTFPIPLDCPLEIVVDTPVSDGVQ